ncbi:MAG: sialate O-acetylesterase [Kiritimatiellales bacterium]
MKKIIKTIGLFTGIVLTSGLHAALLNEWSFEKDNEGLTLSQAANFGTEQSVFSAGGDGFLETDGSHSLVCTHSGTVSSEVWTSGSILNAAITDSGSGIQYVRCDLDCRLGYAGTGSGLVMGLYITDNSGGRVAGISLTSSGAESSAPAGRTLTPVATNLSSVSTLSIIAQVDVKSQTIAVWYGAGGSGTFDENNPAVSSVPIQLSSIDQLQFQVTGDFRPDGTADYLSVDNIRTASTWSEITSPLSVPLTVHSLFQDGMVLQRDMSVPIWGTATPGASVVVYLDGTAAGSTVVKNDGTWIVEMTPASADGGQPHTLTVEPSNGKRIAYLDVVFGDVFLAAGQSNMAGLTAGILGGYEEEKAAADYPLIRQVAIKQITSETVQDEPQYNSQWTACSQESFDRFSGTGYCFAKSLYRQTGEPVGLLFSAWGGQLIEWFLNPVGLTAVPELAGLQQNQEAGGVSTLYGIYNAMIAPLMPYGIRGVIWYQGEANANQQNDGDLYQFKMKALMRGWRKEWGQGDFPFYYVQLPNWSTANNWPGIRNAQLRALTETNSGMAVTIDIGDDGNLHPGNKYDVGSRLARWVSAKDLDLGDIYSGPLYYSSTVEGSQIRVFFDYADSGLIVGQKDGTNPVVVVDEPLQNFEIAGSNRTFVSASAVIDRDTMLVSSASVPEPFYVRYCYAGAPAGSNKLYNAAGLPASPFCTDEPYWVSVVCSTGAVATLALNPGEQGIVTAPAAPDGKVFDRWIGAAAELADVNASSATVTMPDHNLYLFASYRASDVPTYTLTVNSGTGGGTAQSRSIVNIDAAAPPAGQLFDHWVGDTQTVVNSWAAKTTLRMPANNITVTAVYRYADSVGDGIADSWRALYFGGDGTATNSRSSSTADPDGDGATNVQEYLAGTSPVDQESVFRINAVSFNKGAALSFLGVNGCRYRLDATDSLVSPVWQTVCYSILGDGMEKQIKIDTAESSVRFFRFHIRD